MKAGRLVLEQIRGLAEKNIDFAFETTLAGKSHVSFLKNLKKKSILFICFSCGVGKYKTLSYTTENHLKVIAKRFSCGFQMLNWHWLVSKKG